MTRLTLLIINVLVFHTCWLATAFGAAHGLAWMGPAFVIPGLILHFILIENRFRELSTILCVTFIGFSIDYLHHYLGLVQFHPDQLFLGLPPVWLFFQWIIFATLLRVSLDWLKGQYAIAAVLGAVGGPLAYWAAEQLNALMFGESVVFGLGVMAFNWAWMTALFVWIAHCPGTTPAQLPHERTASP